MASTYRSLRQRLALRSGSAQLQIAARRDALGAELARRMRGEMDHEVVRINTVVLLRSRHLPAWVHCARKDGRAIPAPGFPIRRD